MTESGMLLREILPAAVRVCEVSADCDLAVVLPIEAALVARAVPSRQREFATGRACARSALLELGATAEAIGRDAQGAPLWPIGVAGSITHCRGFRAAAVAWQSDIRQIGIDAEPDEPLRPEVRRLIASPEELAALPTSNPVNWDRLLFSAKESVYKAWYPATRTWLGFEDLSVSFAMSGEFEVRLGGHLRSTGPFDGRDFRGRWAAGKGFVLTALCLPA